MNFWYRRSSIFLIVFTLNCCFAIIFEHFIHQLQGLSFLDCKIRCDKEENCLSVRYLRRFSLCEMYDILLRKEVREPGIQIHANTVINLELGFREVDNDLEGRKRVCPVPNVDGAIMLGNLFDIGSKVEFTCRETEKSQAVRCLSDRSWSTNTLFCTSKIYSACGYPGTLQHGQLGALTKLNDSHGVLNISCNTGYTLHFQENVLCEITSGTWSGFELSCCDKLKVSGWTKIYSYPKSLNGGIVGRFEGTGGYINSCSTGFYRNDYIFLNWENTDIIKINFTVISNGTEVAYMLFNGTGTTMKSWFSVEHLINSSWSDLQPSTKVQYFTSRGSNYRDRRWFVARNASSDGTCVDDIGWFVVTWNYYPCEGSKNGGPHILYAKNGSASRFVKDDIRAADKFEIWIQN